MSIRFKKIWNRYRRRPIRCIIGIHDWQFGKEDCIHRSCKICGREEELELKEGWTVSSPSWIYRFILKPIKIKIKSLRKRTIKESLEDIQKVKKGELWKSLNRNLVLGYIMGIVTSIVITIIVFILGWRT